MKKYTTLRLPPRMKGFSLIEFLVASALSMIVLLAVTSTYFTARGLNTAAGQRLSVQQDLRNASAQIVRDARMAGSFGCFNMAKHKAENVLRDSVAETSPFALRSVGQNNLIPLRVVENLDITGFTQNSPALLFQYGIDAMPVNAQRELASNCSTLTKPGGAIATKADARPLLNIQGAENDPNISVLSHVVNAYVVGSFGSGADAQQGLYRFQLEGNNWGNNPQLLIKGVSAMDIRYLYPAAGSCSGDTPVPSFNYATTPDTGADALTPAMIQLVLNNGSINAASDNQVHAYTINATVRGGNTCANLSI